MVRSTVTASMTQPRTLLDALAAEHPCYTESAAQRYGRLHLPVAPRCNLGCNYCERAVGASALGRQGPGVAERVLTPKDACDLVGKVQHLGPLRVVGIAGPGEPLANAETFETLR